MGMCSNCGNMRHYCRDCAGMEEHVWVGLDRCEVRCHCGVVGWSVRKK